MPHLVIQHTPNIKADYKALCLSLLQTLLAIRDEEGKQVFPEGGTRVMTYPAAECAVGDGKGDYGFMYLNLRIFTGRGAAVVKDTGDKLMAVLKEHMEPARSKMPMGITLNIEETPAQLGSPVLLAYEGFHNNLRAVFDR